jgi:hypothetical protein
MGRNLVEGHVSAVGLERIGRTIRLQTLVRWPVILVDANSKVFEQAIVNVVYPPMNK